MTTEDTAELTHVEQAMAYYGGDLVGGEKLAFEAHLAGCAECQRALKTAREVLPLAEKMLAFKPLHSIDEQVAAFERAVAARNAGRSSVGSRPRLVWLAPVALAAGVAAVVLALGVNSVKPPVQPEPPKMMSSPAAPRADGGPP